jgi:hypothetical protein
MYVVYDFQSARHSPLERTPGWLGEGTFYGSHIGNGTDYHKTTGFMVFIHRLEIY